MNLSELKIREEGIVEQVGGEGKMRLRLLEIGLVPETRIRVSKIAPFGDPLEICLRGYRLSLRKEEAKTIRIRRADEHCTDR